MLGLEGNQSFVTGETFFRFRLCLYIIEGKDINAEAGSTPKVDDPVRRFVESAIGARHTVTQRTGLNRDVATVHGSLEELGFM